MKEVHVNDHIVQTAARRQHGCRDKWTHRCAVLCCNSVNVQAVPSLVTGEVDLQHRHIMHCEYACERMHLVGAIACAHNKSRAVSIV